MLLLEQSLRVCLRLLIACCAALTLCAAQHARTCAQIATRPDAAAPGGVSLFVADASDEGHGGELRRDDIKLFEDDAPQQIAGFERRKNQPLSLVIAVDASTSQYETMPLVREKLREFVLRSVRPGDEVALVSFTGEIVLEAITVGDAALLARSIEGLHAIPTPAAGSIVAVPAGSKPPSPDPKISSAVFDAVWAVSDKVFVATANSRSRRALLLVSDGVDTYSRVKLADAAARATSAGVAIYTIAVGEDREYGIDASVLRKLAERTGGRYSKPEDPAEFGRALDALERDLRSYYLVSYIPPSSARGRKRDISHDLRLRPADERLAKRLKLLYARARFDVTSPPAPPKSAQIEPLRRAR